MFSGRLRFAHETFLALIGGMMRFSKNILSQNLRTGCDLALYLTLFTEKELKQEALPTPLEARPGVGTLEEAGIEQEAEIYRRLLEGFGDRCLGGKPSNGSDKWKDRPLKDLLAMVTAWPALLVQAKFTVNNQRGVVLNRLGVTNECAALVPPFEGMIPDLLIAEPARGGMMQLAATGERIPIVGGDARTSLTVVDIKHARQANPSYEAEVALYGIMLANWLVEEQLEGKYFVNADLSLWTRGGVAENILQQALDDGEDDHQQLLSAVRAELEPINLPIYIQAIRRFFSEKLPTVITQGREDWTKLEWHVGPACASCDWLGFEGWLGPKDRKKAAESPQHYCFSRAGFCDHLSRLPLLTRGSRRVLEADGIKTIAELTTTTGEEAIYGKHTKLKSDRHSIPGFATAIKKSESATDPDRPDGMLARYSDLDIFLSINFDPGAGLITGIGLQSYFKQHYPYGQAPTQPVTRNWRDRWIVSAKSHAAEQAAILSFLAQLASIFEFVSDTDVGKGGPHAAQSRAQIIFWDRRQFEELCLALGRHLSAILYDKQDRLLKALAWVFPPEELQETDSLDERRPSIAFARDTVRRLVRVPALHALTLFNVVEHYHHGDPPPDWYSFISRLRSGYGPGWTVVQTRSV